MYIILAVEQLILFIGFQKNLVDQLSFWCPIPPTPQHLVKGMTRKDTTLHAADRQP